MIVYGGPGNRSAPFSYFPFLSDMIDKNILNGTYITYI